MKLNLTNARRRFRDSNAVAAYLFNQLCLLLVFSQPARLEKLFFPKGKLRGVRYNDERLGKLCLPQWGGGGWGHDARRSWKKFPRTQLPKSKLFQILSKHGTAASKRMPLERNGDEKTGKIPRAGKNDPRTRRGFRLHGSEDAVERKRFRELLFEIKKKRRKKNVSRWATEKPASFQRTAPDSPGLLLYGKKLSLRKRGYRSRFLIPPLVLARHLVRATAFSSEAFSVAIIKAVWSRHSASFDAINETVENARHGHPLGRGSSMEIYNGHCQISTKFDYRDASRQRSCVDIYLLGRERERVFRSGEPRSRPTQTSTPIPPRQIKNRSYTNHPLRGKIPDYRHYRANIRI